MTRKLITLAGCDASGKSSMHRRLSSDPLFTNALFVKEPYYAHNIALIKQCDDALKLIELFAKDREQLYNEVIIPDKRDLIISDRSMICNFVYQSLAIEDQYGWTTLEAIDYIERHQPPTLWIDHVIFTKADPTTLTARCQKRNEKMTTQYATMIQSRYEMILEMFNYPYTIINTDQHNLDNSTYIASRVIEQVIGE